MATDTNTTNETARLLDANLRSQGWGNVPNDPIIGCPNYLAAYNTIQQALMANANSTVRTDQETMQILIHSLEKAREMKEEWWQLKIGDRQPTTSLARLSAGYEVPWGESLLCDSEYVTLQKNQSSYPSQGWWRPRY